MIMIQLFKQNSLPIANTVSLVQHHHVMLFFVPGISTVCEVNSPTLCGETNPNICKSL